MIWRSLDAAVEYLHGESCRRWTGTACAAARGVVVGPEEADGTVAVDLPAPPVAVGEWLNDPHKRQLWVAGTTWSVAARQGDSLRNGPAC